MFYQELFEVDIMNIKLKKFNILEPKVKITTGLRAIIFSDNNRFTIHQLVENVSKSNSSEDMMFSIYSDKIECDFDLYFATYYGSCQLGVHLIEFYDKFKYIDCGMYFYNYDSFTRRQGINEWYVNDTGSYTGAWFTTDYLFNFYAYKEFTAHHPVYDNSEYLALEIEKKVHTLNRYKIGDVFDTRISSTENITIVKFASGYWIYKYNGSSPIANFANNTYSFTPVSGVTRINLSNFIGQKYTDKASFSYTSSTGSYSVDLSTEELIVSTCDIVDSNGNVVFSKNANIEDYI